VSPKLGLMVRADARTLVRASAGRAYRAPSLTELYQPAINFGNVVFTSNPELDPEYILSADAGLEHRLLDDVTVQADVFYNDMTDPLTKQVTGNTLRYANTDDAWSSGLELGVSWTFLPECRATLAYTEQRGENRETGNDLEHIADRLASLSVRASHTLRESWRLDASITEHYVGTRGYVDLEDGRWVELEDYWRTDVMTRLTWRDTVWAGLTIENATDERYREWPLINPAPGRLYALELGARW
jgi:iron complex outermembrane receptor protein